MTRNAIDTAIFDTALNRRAWLRLALSGTLAGGLGAVPFASAKAVDLSGVTLRAATYRGGDNTLLSATGLDNFPYKVTFSEFQGGNLIIEAMSGDAIDLGNWSEIPLAFAAAAGAPVRVVAIWKGDVNAQVVLVPKNSTIHDIAGLKGRRVGYVRATTSQYYLAKMLARAGLSFDDIVPINLSPSDGKAAFRSGALDAWAIYPYASYFAIAQDGARVLATANGILSGNYMIGVHPKVLEDPLLSAAAADYIQRVRKAYAWVDANHARWASILGPAIGVPENFVQSGLDHASQPTRVVAIDNAAILSAQDVADTFHKLGLIPKAVDVSPYFDNSFSKLLS